LTLSRGNADQWQQARPALSYAFFYNLKWTKSAALALSTSMLQQLAVLGLFFLFFRWHGDKVNGRYGS
jgi:hypothetical protein